MNIFKKIFGNNQNDKKEVITMTNTEKAIALINTFATGDTEKASELLAENYIQHNLAYDTGRDAFVGSVSYLASAPVKTTVNNIRAFEDGDKVFLQTFYNFADVGEQVAFDIFRFDENGKIAEHTGTTLQTRQSRTRQVTRKQTALWKSTTLIRQSQTVGS